MPAKKKSSTKSVAKSKAKKVSSTSKRSSTKKATSKTTKAKTAKAKATRAPKAAKAKTSKVTKAKKKTAEKTRTKKVTKAAATKPGKSATGVKKSTTRQKKDLPKPKKAKTTSKKSDTKKTAAHQKTITKSTVEAALSAKFQEGTTYRTSSPSKTELATFRKANEQKRQAARKAVASKFDLKSFIRKPGKRGKSYQVDLRIQTPGTLGYFAVGGVEPGPALCRLAKVKGLDMIGLTDFYSTEHLALLNNFESETELTIIPGVDLRCRLDRCDEVYLTVLFSEASGINKLLEKLDLPNEAKGNPDFILDQQLEEVINLSEKCGGVVIPSKIDKTPHRSLIIPRLVEDFGFHVFDLVYAENPNKFKDNWPKGEFTFLCFSNAQALAQIGSRSSTLKLSKPGFEGLKELAARRL